MLTELRARAFLSSIGIVFALIAAVTLFPVELAAQSPSVTATPTTVAPGGTLTVTIANGPGNPTDWVALALTSAPDTTYGDWKYLNNSTLAPPVPGLTGATVQLVAPATGGVSEVRFFANFGFTRLATSSPITVQGTPPAAPTVTASPGTVAAGGVITVTVANGPGNINDWVGLVEASAPDTSYVAWQHLNGTQSLPPTGFTSATLQFVAPTTPGTYTARLINSWNRLATSNAVTVQTATLPTLAINNASVTEGNSGPAPAAFTVTLSATSTSTVTVNYATSNGTATAGSDYVAASGTLTFAPGVVTRPLAVSATGDTTVEPDETFVVTLSSPSNAVLGDAQGTGTIMNDDAALPPTVTASPGTVAAGGVITVTVANGPGNPNDWVGLVEASAPDTSYVAWQHLNGTQSLPATGFTSATLQFVAPMTPGTYTARLINSWNRLATSNAVTVQTTALPTLAINNASVTEGNSGPASAAFTVTLSATSTSTVTVNYATSNGTAAAGSDYVAVSGTLTFAPGVVTRPLAVSATGDTTVEPDETFVVTLSSPSNAVLGDAQGTGTIVNDDTAPVPTLTASPATVAAGGVITVTVANGPGNPSDWVALAQSSAPDSSHVAWQHLNGTQSLPPTGFTSATLQFVAPMTPGTYTARLINAGTRLATSSVVTVQPALPTLAINNASVTEGNSGSASAAFTVTLSATSTSTVTVNYATSNGTAAAGSDYVAASGTLTFAPGVVTRPLAVSATGDTTVEPDETFVVTLSSPSNAVLGDAQGTGTIVNDDTAPVPTLTASPATVAAGGVITVTVANGPGNPSDWVALAQSSAPDSSHVAWQHLNGTQSLPPTGFTSATLQFVAPMTPGTYTARLINAGTRLATSSVVTVQPALPTLAINNASVTEGNSGPASAAFTVTLSATSTSTVTVNYATSNGTATAGSDYVAASGTLTFAPGVVTRPLAVSATGDTTVEPDETFVVTLTSPTNAVVSDGSGAGTIVNDDTAPVPTVTAAPATVAPGGVITATIANGPGGVSDWVVVAASTAPDPSYFDWKYFNGLPTPPPTGMTSATVQLVVPMTPGTYQVRLFANGGFTRLATSGSVTVAGDTTLPVISAVAASAITATGATINWTTNEASDTQVNYGPTTAYGSSTVLNGSLLTAHTASMSGLTASTLYHYRVRSRDAAGNLALSGDFTFTTLATQAPLNLVAAYAYNEGGGTTAADNSVNANTATVSGTSWSTSCQFGTCLAFNGTSSFVDTPDDDVLSPGANATFEAWVFLTAAPTDLASVFNKWSQTADDEYIFGVNPNRTLFFGWHTTGGDTFPSPAFDLVNGTGAVALNTWTHIAVVRNGAALTFYRNGVVDSSQSVLDTQPFRNGITTLRVGGQSRGGGGRFFPGRIDEARIYNRTLTQAEIQSDMTTPIALDTTAPVLSAISASAITAAGATIVWTTNEASDSQVDYGTTTAYGSVSPLNGSLVTAHSVIVGALAANTTYHFRVRSKDAAGNIAVSGNFTFTTLVLDLVAPVVSITAPANNATVSGTVTFSANATDAVGVTGVEFKRDGVNVAPEDTAAPYTVSWNTTTTTQGVHTLTAVAWDAAGNSATATRTVTVSNPLATVQLAWDANTEADLAGYRVKVGTTSGVYTLSNISVGNVTSYTVTGLPPGDVYYFAVTAVNLSGAESVASNEVSASR